MLPVHGGTLANLALSLLGRVAGQSELHIVRACAAIVHKPCGMTALSPPRRFWKRCGTGVADGLVCWRYHATISGFDTFVALLKARLLPLSLLGCSKVLLPTAGSGDLILWQHGDPKGVMLTHHNILSNVEALRMRLPGGSERQLYARHAVFFTSALPPPSGSRWSRLFSGLSQQPMEGLKRSPRWPGKTNPLCWPPPHFSWPTCAGKEKDFPTLRLVITVRKSSRPRGR